MAGGTFTISNGGVYGSLLSTPIINPPQSAILGMHSINPRAAVRRPVSSGTPFVDGNTCTCKGASALDALDVGPGNPSKHQRAWVHVMRTMFLGHMFPCKQISQQSWYAAVRTRFRMQCCVFALACNVRLPEVSCEVAVAVWRQVVGKEQAIMPRPIMNVALTYDHRLIDGREGVTFLKRVKEIVEDPRRLLLDV